MPSPDPVVAVRGVSRRFGHRWVVKDISFEVPPGEALLLVGGNGAGKTTLLRVIAGLLNPTAGAVERHAMAGMVAHHTMLYDALTARENLWFFARLHGVAERGRVDALLERLGLGSVAGERIAIFSRGMLQRLAIARALLHDPELLLLDEPLSGLDETAAQIVLDVVAELRARGGALVIATHQLAELVAVAARVGYIVSGRLAALEPVDGRDAASVMNRYRELAAGAR
ncbi:MAG: ATP-binding cassette domain-containing protein [Gemmatimonadales bacterium]|nr:ATP-binding cassette domain-containing protein [Gemmatimonadales bacterium]NIN12850.1 ATP-binding cassette domain-containing protein [Gemmatimonadales bacterium]NIN51028.1 ATP-binding cassette domain-containing protein [Gemmatimonadales bacterium]NIP08492.1 ATP-binding cassette domain-containing protein [Gemmatimonadales bacterium]NIR02532.1 ATP-binding cassette domain-containing protein [Gemmatimonadales bacterium]